MLSYGEKQKNYLKKKVDKSSSFWKSDGTILEKLGTLNL